MKTHSTRLLRVTRHEPRLDDGRALEPGLQLDSDRAALPLLLTVDEAADLLRTSRRAIYAMVERRQLSGVVRIRRRVLFRTEALLHWLHQKSAPSLEE